MSLLDRVGGVVLPDVKLEHKIEKQTLIGVGVIAVLVTGIIMVGLKAIKKK